jgi:hypothetical protein
MIRGPFEELVGGFEHVDGSFAMWLAVRGYPTAKRDASKNPDGFP